MPNLYGRPHYDVYADLARACARRAKKNGTPCHLCGLPIDWDAPWHAQMAFTYDHDVPIALGGNPRGPGKPAHRSCNSRRGKRAVRAPLKTTRRWR